MDLDDEIAPGRRVRNWLELRRRLNDPDDGSAWEEAIGILKGRIESRFLRPVDHLVKAPQEVQAGVGFSIAALDCLLIDTIQSFKEGRIAGDPPRTARSFKTFLQTRPRLKGFTSEAIDLFYNAIRNGIMHDGETRHRWLIRRAPRSGEERSKIIEKRPGRRAGFILYRDNFHTALVQKFNAYLVSLSSQDVELRANFLKRMDSICADDPATISYFAYGSNMDPTEMKAKGVPNAIPLGRWSASGYRLTFNKISRKHGAAANLQPDEKGSVAWGCIFELTPGQLDCIREKEVGYFEQAIEVTSDGGAMAQARTFMASGRRVVSGHPSPEYLSVITEAARKLGLPNAYIEELESKGRREDQG